MNYHYISISEEEQMTLDHRRYRRFRQPDQYARQMNSLTWSVSRQIGEQIQYIRAASVSHLTKRQSTEDETYAHVQLATKSKAKQPGRY